MIRRTALAAIAAIAAVVVLAAGAQAATRITLQCIRSERLKLRSCRSACLAEFRNTQPTCFGPGLECARKCQMKNDECSKPVNDTLAVCNTGCAQQLDAALENCRLTAGDEDACANKARLDNLQCRLNCVDAIDELRAACGQENSQCLAACASCATPTECPAQQ